MALILRHGLMPKRCVSRRAFRRAEVALRCRWRAAWVWGVAAASFSFAREVASVLRRNPRRLQASFAVSAVDGGRYFYSTPVGGQFPRRSYPPRYCFDPVC